MTSWALYVITALCANRLLAIKKTYRIYKSFVPLIKFSCCLPVEKLKNYELPHLGQANELKYTAYLSELSSSFDCVFSFGFQRLLIRKVQSVLDSFQLTFFQYFLNFCLTH